MLIRSITKIKNNVRITLDDNRNVIIRYEVFLNNGLRKGDEINDEFISSLIEQNILFHAKQSALGLIARRTHSETEIRRKLQIKKYDKSLIDRIISELRERSYLDDEQFAREYYEEKAIKKGLGINRVIAGLRAKGVRKEIIEKLLSQYPGMDQTEQAVIAAEKKLRSLRARSLEDRKIRQSLYSHLLSKGFDFETSRSVVEKLLGE